MNTRDVLNAVLGRERMTQYEAGELIGWTPKQMSYRIIKDSVRVADLIRILDAIGYELSVTNKSTGETIRVTEFRPGHGRRVRNMFNHVMFDTKVSSAISNTFYADGVNEYDEEGCAEELYLDKEGRYFIAEYHLNDPDKDRVRMVNGKIAKAFIEMYGTEIEKR